MSNVSNDITLVSNIDVLLSCLAINSSLEKSGGGFFNLKRSGLALKGLWGLCVEKSIGPNGSTKSSDIIHLLVFKWYC